jgi:flagellum-specific ATP synthase
LLVQLTQISRTLNAHLHETPRLRLCGKVQRASGLLLEASGLDLAVGDECVLELAGGDLPAEIVGFSGSTSYLMPLAPLHGVAPGTRVTAQLKNTLPEAQALLGRVVDALGQPLDQGPRLASSVARPSRRDTAINPLNRKPISEVLDVGVRSINGLLSVGVGQRLGIFAGSGVGKSVLLGMLARFTAADAVVVGLIGERGREVQEFIEDNLGTGLRKSIVVAAPADASPALRLRGADLAMRLAESLRAQGKKVLLLMDSLTRVAQAQREIGLSMGEPPTVKGYTPSAFAALPALVERAGQTVNEGGSITAFFTVLMEEDDLQDPIVDAARAVLDGHIVLSRKLADRGHYPAIDVEASISRLMLKLADSKQREAAMRFRALWSRYAEQEDLISVGAYQPGSDPETDAAIAAKPDLSRYLKQQPEDRVSLAESREMLQQLNRPAAAVTTGVTGNG